jgi:hypothetical protein
MFTRMLCCFSLAVLAAGTAAATGIEYTTGVATGVLFLGGRLPDLREGLHLTFPVKEYMANKSYSAQIIELGSADKSEAFAAVGGSKSLGFGSAIADGQAALDVGVTDGLRSGVFWWAVSRFYSTIKNNSEEDFLADFFYTIEPGELGIQGPISDNSAHARVEATVDLRLLSPSGPGGGTWDETTGRFLDYYVDIDVDGKLTKSNNATVAPLTASDTSISYKTGKLKGKISLPPIPPHGEMTVYYDMYALMDSHRPEMGGYARLGDPTDLVPGEGGRLVPRGLSPVPEPTTLLLFGGGLAALGVSRRFLGRLSS